MGSQTSEVVGNGLVDHVQDFVIDDSFHNTAIGFNNDLSIDCCVFGGKEEE